LYKFSPIATKNLIAGIRSLLLFAIALLIIANYMEAGFSNNAFIFKSLLLFLCIIAKLTF